MLCFTDTATTEHYTLSLHDALPILVPARIEGHDVGLALAQHARRDRPRAQLDVPRVVEAALVEAEQRPQVARSEEHTSELQSHVNLVCRLLLEKKNNVAKMCRLKGK